MGRPPPNAAAQGEVRGSRFADVYLHETAISNIRRLLDHEFTCARAHETVAQFRLMDGTGFPGL